MYKPFIIDCSWAISNLLSKVINTYPSHIAFESNWILGSVLSVLSVPVLIHSANSLKFCEPLHLYLWTSIVNLYTVPHFFFIDFRKFDSTRECIFYIVFRGFCKSTKVIFYILGDSVRLLHADQIQLILLWIPLLWTKCHLSANRPSI